MDDVTPGNEPAPSGLPYDSPLHQHFRALYRLTFADGRRDRAFLASSSFFLTFSTVRVIVHLIRAGRGPFHNVTAGGKHIHHLVWGILLLLLTGYIWLLQLGTGLDQPRRRWMRATAILYGVGAALTLDEFALWLNLVDDYWAPQGRESIDVVIVFGGLLSSVFCGHPFLRAVTRLVIRRGVGPGKQSPPDQCGSV